jgi:hypothetical protein
LSLELPTRAEPTKLIHILNWHYVSRDDYAAGLKASIVKPLTDDHNNKYYLAFIEDGRTIHKQQMELIKKHNLKALYVEGLTERNHKGILEVLESMKKY